MSFRARDYLARPGELLRLRRWMSRTPRWDPERMQQWQIRRMRELLDHAYTRVPYYRERLAPVDPRSVRSFADWAELPVLDRDIVRTCTDELLSVDAMRRGGTWRSTSGTTGSPLRVFHDRHVDTAAFNLFWRQWSEAGWRPGRSQVVLSGDEPEWSYRWLTRIAYVPSFELLDTTVSRFLQVVHRHRPAIVRGHPSSVALLARLIERSGAEIRFTGAVTHSELLLPAHREQIERTFGVRVVDHYTHWERAASIGQCHAGRYHAHVDFGHVEILRDDGSPAEPGEVGRIVATGLHNRAMPLLRYDTGDHARWSEQQRCDCGSRFPIVERLDGRSDDFVVTPEGRHVKLSNAFKHLRHVRESQVVQPALDHVVVRIVPEQGYDASGDEEVLLGQLRLRLGETIRIEVEHCNALPRTPGGKTRLIVSELESTGEPPPAHSPS